VSSRDIKNRTIKSPSERTSTCTTRDFLPRVDEVGAARHFAAGVARSWGVPADDLVLVVGELAANSYRHARGGFSVSIGNENGVLLVEVTDASPQAPRILTPSRDAQSGRGLAIVARIARSWGTRPTSDGGKTVWVELDVDDPN
jgi:anti-sigma regulatory factor (Ser/Thr protein kinase)